MHPDTIIDKFFLITYSLYFYVSKSVFPINLCALHPFPDKSLHFSILTFNGLLFPLKYYFSFLGLLIIIILLFFLKNYRKEIIAGSLFFLINIMLVLQFIPFGSALVSERYTYVAYIGLFFVIASILFDNNLLTQKFKFTIPNINYQSSILNFFLIALIILFASMTYKRNKIWMNGISLFNDVIKEYPKLELGYIYLGNTEYYNHDYKNAIRNYDKAIALSPRYYLSYYCRGYTKQTMKDYDGAVQDYTMAIKLNKMFCDSYYDRGTIRYIEKDYNDAIDDFAMALNLKPKEINLYLIYDYLGNAEKNTGLLDIALKDFNMAISINPNAFMTYYNRGELKKMLGDYKGAFIDFSKVVKLNPRYSSVYNEMGTIRCIYNDFDDAIQDYNIAIKLNPGCAEIYVNRANAKRLNGDYKGAIEDLTTGYKLDTTKINLLTSRGLIKLTTHGIEGACLDWKIACLKGDSNALQFIKKYCKKCNNKK